MKIYHGWIHGKPEDAEVLRDLGVELGPWHEDIQAWKPCELTPQVLDRLQRMLGRFLWGLDVIEKDPS